jgi:hypothetical protein
MSAGELRRKGDREALRCLALSVLCMSVSAFLGLMDFTGEPPRLRARLRTLLLNLNPPS